MRKKWKRSRVILPLLLSAIMVLEPAAAASTVYAEEGEPAIVITEEEQTEDTDAVETPADGTEDNDQNVGDEGENDPVENEDENDGDDSDTTDGEQGNTDEDGSGESGDDQDDSDEPGESEESNPDNDESDESEDDVNEEEESDEEDVSDEEADIEDSEEETLEDEDNWQGTGHKAPKLEMQLTSAMVAEKQALNGTAERLELLEENVQYIANRAVFLADSKKYADTVAEGYGATLDSYEEGVAVMVFADDVADIIAMAEDEKVKLPAVYPNYIYTICEDEVYTYSDVELSDIVSTVEVSGNPDPSIGSQYYHDEINSKAAWAYNPTAGSGIKVAVIDSGIQKNHEDLNGRVASASTTASAPYNKAEDNNSHGTHVSGIIAATKDNGKGGAGIAYKASIVSIKALENNPLTGGANGSTADIIKAVNSAVKSGARVINMSLGGNYYDALFQSVVTTAVNKGVVVVVAAGNDYKEMSKTTSANNYYSPACFDDVITVSAKQKGSATKADFSNSGNGIIDITAPGTEIYSCIPNSSYKSFEGTSQATPMVAAAAAYILSVSPDLKNSKTRATVETVTKILKDSATKSGYSSNPSHFGAGLLNVEAAIKMAAPAAEEKGGTGELTAPVIATGAKTLVANDKIQDTDAITLSATVGNASNNAIKIYYTLDGKTPTEKSTEYKSPFRIEASGNKTIKAIAVYYGKKSKVTSVKVNVNAYVQSFTVSSKTNSKYLGAGKSLTLAADAKNFTPSYATNKKVKWEIVGDGNNFATINASGKLTANADIEKLTQITVRATALDRESGTTASIDITLLPKVTALTLTAPVLENASKPYELEYDTNKTVQMTVGVEPATAATAQAGIAYSSSNDKIAIVNNSGLVTAVGNGTATITAKTTDGSNKKVSFKVKVTKRVQSVEVTTKTGEYQIAAGKSLQMVANVTSDATNKKVNWEIAAGSDFATLSSSGKLTAKSVTAVSTVQVKATAADNSGKSDTKTVTIYPVVIKSVALEEGTSGNLATTAIGTLKTSLQLHPYTTEDNTDAAKLFGRVKGSGTTGLGNFTYTSSNTKVATVNPNTGLVQVAGDGKTGTAKIKVAAKDGSGKSATYTVKVIKPVTSISVYPKNGVSVVGKGKTLTLGASVNGDASIKKLSWTVDKSEFATISNGKVKGKNYNTDGSDASVTVTATATDGSEVKASYTIKVRPLITKLAFWVTYYWGSIPIKQGFATSCTGNMTLGTYSHISNLMPYYFDQTSGNSEPRGSGGSRYWDRWEGTDFTCSNSNVLQIIYDSSGNIYVYPVNKGTATLTFKALDGSKKSCKMKITVNKK